MISKELFDALDERRRNAEALRRQREDESFTTNQVGDPIVFNAARVEADTSTLVSSNNPVQVERGHWTYRGFHITLKDDAYTLWVISHPEIELPDALKGTFTQVSRAARAIDFLEDYKSSSA